MAHLPYCAISEKAKAVNLARICYPDRRGTSVIKSREWDRARSGVTSMVRGGLGVLRIAELLAQPPYV
ncbi:MAG: hypothetical protein HZC50_06885 [Nitrospirae bacterium]|nr:hypothetical protein [Nitrospirota bacterium]